MNIHELTLYLQERGNILIGCSRWEVSSLEKYFRIKLPAVYKEFLYSMGKEAGVFMRGSDGFYRHVFLLKENFLSEMFDKELEVPEQAFVFWTHQGYQYAFFLLDEGDDPPVYYYLEGEPAFEKFESLGAFLESQIGL